jgi:bacteriocin-like protein
MNNNNQQDRVLAYQMATTIDNTELAQVSGGQNNNKSYLTMNRTLSINSINNTTENRQSQRDGQWDY